MGKIILDNIRDLLTINHIFKQKYKPHKTQLTVLKKTEPIKELINFIFFNNLAKIKWACVGYCSTRKTGAPLNIWVAHFLSPCANQTSKSMRLIRIV